MFKQNYWLTLFCISLFLLGCQGSSQDQTTNDLPSPTSEENITQNTEDALTSEESLCLGSIESLSNCHEYAKHLLESIATHHYLSPSWTKINKTNLYTSDLSHTKYIDIYIDSDANEYAKIDPDIEFSSIEVSEGTTIIREVWDAENTLEKYTVMIKMEAGYFPEGGDFLYAEVLHDGHVLQGGRLQSCAKCHQARQHDGFLFGVRNELKTNTIDRTEMDNHFANLAKQTIVNRDYLKNTEFFPLNSTAYASELSPDNYIKVYISQFASLNYLTVHRDRENSHARLPEETVIIREVQDESGKIKNITAMVKANKGYYPEGGDFFYGVYDSDGNTILDDGRALAGRLFDCGDCHRTQRENDGFLFGVSSKNRH